MKGGFLLVLIVSIVVIGASINWVLNSDMFTVVTPIDTTGAYAYSIRKIEYRKNDSINKLIADSVWISKNKKAHKIQLTHTEWSRTDCEKLAKNEIWIGMSFDMLKYVYGGNPDVANPSDSGNGVSWQWCWHGFNPSCFYDRNNDGLIDSYN